VSINKQLVQTAKVLRLKKGLSQSFLVDEDILQKIAHAATVDLEPTLPLVEIGSGGGFLTRYLLASEHPLTAIEVDSKMVRVLNEAFGQNPHFTLLHQDVLTVNLNELITPKGAIIGNIPYHLTGPILFHLTGELSDAVFPLRQSVSRVLLMVQKEVAERLVAAPGTKAYGQLTLQAQFWFEITPVVFVPRTAFYPVPAVDSMVIQLIPREKPVIEPRDLAFLSRFIKLAFTHRRKTLMNNLKLAGLAAEPKLREIFEQAAIPLEIRPQGVSIQQFGALADALLP
jgi:16S rRNA (adenine1518-N6/adenine1519-N6)-dimethyltransferase